VATVDSTLRFLLLPQLHRLRGEGYEVVAVSAPGEWVPSLEATGIRHVPWTRVTRSWNLVADVRAFAELIGILRRERFDVVHTHTPKPGIMGRLAARLTGIPCVMNTVHGLYATPDDPLAKRMAVLGVEGVAARLSDLELYQSEEDLSWARRRGVVPDGRGVLLGNGADLEHFDPSAATPERVAALRRELGLERAVIVVGTVGRLVEEKGYRELFAAADRVCEERPDVRFLVVGEIDEHKADAIRREEIEAAGKHVTFSGWRQDVRDLLAAMDVFVLPSWREGLPRSAIEAAAMGKPMVLTDVRGRREVVRDGVEGILVPPRDPAALAEAIATLVESPELRSEYGAAARARAVARFDERMVEERILGAYEEVLAGKGLRTPTTEGVGVR
jgi:glycosyltransferase involved in cell wall biosynthesis